MRTSLNKLQAIEAHLLFQADTGDALVFEARMLLDAGLAEEVALQKESYQVIHHYGRRRLKAELETVHQQLFTLPKHQRFRQKILALFK